MAITAATVIVGGVSQQHIRYNITEDGNAVGAAVQLDVLADLVAAGIPVTAPLYVALNNGGVALLNQAAAMTLVETEGLQITDTIITYGGGATASPNLVVVANVNGAGVGNFRFDVVSVKAANTDTAFYVLDIDHMHSVVQ